MLSFCTRGCQENGDIHRCHFLNQEMFVSDFPSLSFTAPLYLPLDVAKTVQITHFVEHQTTNQKVMGSFPRLGGAILCFRNCPLSLFWVEHVAIYLPKNRLELVMTPRNTVRITVHHCIIEILLKMALIPTKKNKTRSWSYDHWQLWGN